MVYIPGWLGALAALLVVASGIVWFRRVNSVSLPENRAGFVATWLSAAVLGVLTLMSSPGWLFGTLAGIAVFAGLFFILTFSISRQVVDTNAITVGGQLPVFSAPNDENLVFESASLAGKPVLIKFFRGHW